jgi:type II secretory pathway pseudopilin PulG
MKKNIIFGLTAFGLIISSANSQNQSARCQEVDKQLNKIYQQLKASLTDSQKNQLIRDQRAWIVQRDTYIANSANKEEAFFLATFQRNVQLEQYRQSKLIKVPESDFSKNIIGTWFYHNIEQTFFSNGKTKTISYKYKLRGEGTWVLNGDILNQDVITRDLNTKVFNDHYKSSEKICFMNSEQMGLADASGDGSTPVIWLKVK